MEYETTSRGLLVKMNLIIKLYKNSRRRNIMHPMFVKLFMETDADDLLAEEQDQRRRTRQARRGRSARVLKVAAANQDRPRRP